MDVDGDPIDLCVGTSQYEAGELMAAHLVETGRRRIGYSRCLGVSDRIGSAQAPGGLRRQRSPGAGWISPNAYRGCALVPDYRACRLRCHPRRARLTLMPSTSRMTIWRSGPFFIAGRTA